MEKEAKHAASKQEEVSAKPESLHAHEDRIVKKGQSRLWVIIGIAVVVIGGLIWWYTQRQAKPVVAPRDVKVGVLDPISGVWTNVGTSIKEGIEFATKENAAEGLHITYIYKDTACDGTKSEQATKELVSEGVIAIIGDLCSGSTLKALTVAAAAKIPMVSATSTSPKLSEGGPYFSRTIPSDAASSVFTADLLYNKKQIKKLAIIHSDDLYGTGLNEAVTKSFEKLGGTVVNSQAFKNEVTNVTTQVTSIKAAKPEALYLVTASEVTWIAIMKKMKELGMTIPVYTSESLKDLTFIKDAGPLAEGMFVIAVSEGTPAYIEKHQGAFGTDPGLYNAQAYDAARAVVEALNTGAAAGEEIRDAIRKVEFDGASGHIKFDGNGDVAPNFTVFKVVDGKFRAED